MLFFGPVPSLHIWILLTRERTLALIITHRLFWHICSWSRLVFYCRRLNAPNFAYVKKIFSEFSEFNWKFWSFDECVSESQPIACQKTLNKHVHKLASEEENRDRNQFELSICLSIHVAQSTSFLRVIIKWIFNCHTFFYYVPRLRTCTMYVHLILIVPPHWNIEIAFFIDLWVNKIHLFVFDLCVRIYFSCPLI